MGARRTPTRSLLVTLAALAILVGTVTPALGASVVLFDEPAELLATATELSYEAEFLQLINEERAAENLQPLARLDTLVEGARGQAQAILEAGYLFHNPQLADVTTGWYALGENVGYGPTVIALHNAFMDSPGHRANVLKDTYNYGGVGVLLDENSVIWVAIVFMYGPEGLAESPVDAEEPFGPPFRDDEGSVHEDAIGAIAAAGITAGCDAADAVYCPDDVVSRGQMATFLMRALDLPASVVDAFADDAGSAHEAAINAVAAAGLTSGCGAGMFCPDAPVTRAQMATFLMRALDLDPSDQDRFTDDEGSTHETAINALAAAGISGGCDAGRFCPDAEVSRAQMASFLARALGLI